MWRNWNPHTLQVGIWNGSAAVENSLAAPQKLKHRLIIWPRSSPPGLCPWPSWDASPPCCLKGKLGPCSMVRLSSVPFLAFQVAYGSSYLSLPTTSSFPSPKPQLVIFPRESNPGLLKKPLQRIQSPLRVLPCTRGHVHAHGWLPASAPHFLHPHLPGAWVRSD